MALNGTKAMSVFLLIRSLETGGAERQLVQLAIGLSKRAVEVTVGLYYKSGPLVAELETAGISIVDLRKRGRWDVVGFLVRTQRALRAVNPDIVYSFLGTANIVAAVLRAFTPRFKLVWSIRASDVDLSHYNALASVSYAVERLLSPCPDLIISNSLAGRDFAARNGFPRTNLEVVPNGIDVDRFRQVPELRAKQRAQWGATDETLLVGVLARLDPMKGHRVFLQAAAQLEHQHENMKFVCIGSGPEECRLGKQAGELGLEGKVLFPGASPDPVTSLNALDICCSPSVFGEGFSNSIAEAMACGVPCVVTDVGDSAMLVGTTGVVVPRNDANALASGILRCAARRGHATSEATRARIVQHFSADAMVDRTLDMLMKIACSPAAKR